MKPYTRLGSCLVLAVCVVGIGGCAAGGGGGGGGEAEGPGPEQEGELTANFDEVEGGNYMVGRDEDGNQYTVREEGGAITEGNVRFGDGTVVKASLDSQGRPVKFRSSTGENADIIYGDVGARIRYLSAGADPQDPDAYEDVPEINTTAAKARVQARRTAYEAKRRRAMQDRDPVSTNGGAEDGDDLIIAPGPDDGDDMVVAPDEGDGSNRERVVREGFETFEEITESIFDEEANPNNPMRGTRLHDCANLLGRLASTTAIEDVGRDVLGDVELDGTPPEIDALAGRTFVLFEAEGFCVEEAGLENYLTFDGDGVLLTEFDRNFIFPDFSMGGPNPGFTISYATGSPVDLTRGEDAGFEAIVTPVFTGTQLDGSGLITVERRFLADIKFEVTLFTSTTASTEQLFNAAFINGELNGDVLEFDLVLVDLVEETPVAELGRVRYYDQNTLPPEERLFPCEVITGEGGGDALECPMAADVGRPFEVAFDARDRQRELDYDWFVSAGWGYMENPFDPVASVVPTDEGPLEITLIVSDLSVEPEVFEIYACEVIVGDITGTEGFEGAIDCPEEMTVGQAGFFAMSGEFDPDSYEDYDLYIFGTSFYEVYIDEMAMQAEITFWEAGRFEVGLFAYGDESEAYFFCEVMVYAGHEEDFCEQWGWYGDGVCDLECLAPDPDCTGFEDWCEELGWYGDGICDEECPGEDPDCTVGDFCREMGYYDDGVCDEFCDADPDCEGEFDECEELGYYGDGFCDEFCPMPDPDCDDWCAQLGWYGDGYCDLDCPLPDPDCEDWGTNGWGTNGWGTNGWGTNGWATDSL